MNWQTISKGLKEAAPILIGIAFLLALVFTVYRVVLAHPQLTPEEEYVRAVSESVQPDPSWVVHSLEKVELNEPLTVVAWMNEKSVSDYKSGKPAPDKDTWVTMAPKLKYFCQDYVRQHGADPDQLDLRLEQRLGLSPDPSIKYTRVVELTIDPGDFYTSKSTDTISKLFRPCADPSLDTNTCELERSLPDPDPKKPGNLARLPRGLGEVDAALGIQSSLRAHQYWFLSKYYWSFASVPGYQFPWTSLGYTFDWAPKEDGSDDFVRRGEDEFVIPAKTKLKFVSSPIPTLEYCTPH